MELHVKEKDIKQGRFEKQRYTLTTTPYASNPTNTEFHAYDVSQSFKDVDADVLSGSTSVSGNVITSKLIGFLTMGHVYRFDFIFTVGTQIYQVPFHVTCVR